jgi:signal transduction histidine kinase
VKAPDPERLRIVVHEVRSPVAALDALATAAATTDDPELIRRMVVLGVAAARDVARLVSDPELVSLRLDHVDLAALAATFARPDVSVEIDGPATVDGDATRLRQVLSNLVANALRHGTRAAIEVRTRNGRVVVSVADDGPGIASGADPFARGASGAGSTGYGLWLSRAIAEAHGGTLELGEAPERGASLRLSLPSSS